MLNFKFELYKIDREIKRSGIEVKAFRPVKNTYGEKTENYVSLSSVRGVYHENTSYVEEKSAEATRYRRTKEPMFLTTKTHLASLELQVDDVLEMQGKKFRIIKIQDIQEKGQIFDISLGVDDIGN